MADILTADALEGVPHGFSTRAPFSSDEVMTGARLVMVRQVHGAKALIASRPYDDDPPDADALVTGEAGLLIGIVTADCAPVLFADRRAGVVGAAHAGWRGALSGVLENTIDTMAELGARREDIVAVIGPTIAAVSYEVDRAFADRFVAADAANSRWFTPGRAGHAHFDLPGYVADRLLKAGIDTVQDLARDTYREPGVFYSYRRATHEGQPTGGRQISVIGLP